MSGSKHGHGDLSISYGALLHAYAACRSFAQAVAVFKSLPSKGVQPSTRIYNAVMNGYAQVCLTSACTAASGSSALSSHDVISSPLC